MNFRRSVFGFAITLAVPAGCSTGDATTSDAGGPDSTAQADTGSVTGGDAATSSDTRSGTQGDAATSSDTGLEATPGDSAMPPATDAAVSPVEAGAGGSLDAAPADAADAPLAPTCGPFADGGMGLPDAGPAPANMSFFVSSQKNATGNLGGLAAADLLCQTLATAVGAGSPKVWHAYLSVEHDASNGGNPTNAHDRIGTGPWYNSRGNLVAADLSALHSRTGDPLLFLDEHGQMINGQWTHSPTPNEHDILTGSNADGTLAVGKTCLDWTSAQPAADAGVPDGGERSVARVGHTDGFGPSCSTTPTLPSWNSAHDNAGCDNTAPRGGAGRIYCFAIR